MRHLLTLVLAALAVLVPAVAAEAKMQIAIEAEDVLVDNTANITREQGFQALSQLRIRNQRILITQGGTQRGDGSFDFTRYVQAIDEARARGIKSQVVLIGRYPRPNVAEYGRFVEAAAQALQGRVTAYSIWNEPNYVAWLAPLKKAPALYAKLYRAGYSAIKRTDRRAKVLIGETAPYAQGRRAMAPVKFVRQMVKRAPALKADGFAHHPYDFERAPKRSIRGRNDATIGSLSNLTRVLDELARKGELRGTKALYLTEYGYLATGRRGLKEGKRAQYLKQGLAIAKKNRRVKQIVQYLLTQPNDGSSFTTGIMSANGAPTASFRVLRSFR